MMAPMARQTVRRTGENKGLELWFTVYRAFCREGAGPS